MFHCLNCYKKAIFLLLVLAFPPILVAQNARVESRVDSLVSIMTIDEKIGQMYQISFRANLDDGLRNKIRSGEIGSVINIVDPRLINEIQKIAVEESRLGIPVIIGRDVIHGFRTIFPIPLGQAASWNPELVEKAAHISAIEARSVGVTWTFSPMVDVSRDPRWGRIAESFGEDVYLSSVFSAAMVKGYQGDDLTSNDRIAACVKHFAGYGAAEGGRDYNTPQIPMTQLWNVYLPPFKAAVDAGAMSLMTGFNDLDGIPASGNSFLLRKILKNEWGFKGFVVSDWNSIPEMIVHGYSENLLEAALDALDAGVDMEMASESYRGSIKLLLEAGRIDQKLIDDAVRRVLYVKFSLGLFDNPFISLEHDKLLTSENLSVATKLAEESIVLLKNENNLLPVTIKTKVAIIGPMSDDGYEQMGTWSFDGKRENSVTPLSALRELLPAENVTYVQALSTTRDLKMDFKEAVRSARKADVAILFLGEEAILSGEAHSRAQINLPGAQEDLIKAIHATGTPVVVVVMAGRPISMNNVMDYCDAVLLAWHPGTMGGPAIANILLGKAVPSGKLPVTIPVSSGQIPIYYSHFRTGRPTMRANYQNINDIPQYARQSSLGNTSNYLDEGYKPLFPFGFGLSYTSFEYSDLDTDDSSFSKEGIIDIRVTVKNTGDFRGREVVQLYVNDKYASLIRPVRELKVFKAVELNPGESRVVEFSLPCRQLGFYNNEGTYIVEEGVFMIWVGGDSNASLGKELRIQ